MDRIATVERNTFETQISLTLNLDGSGKCSVKNPIGFFDHMLQAFCKHGMFDKNVSKPSEKTMPLSLLKTTTLNPR